MKKFTLEITIVDPEDEREMRRTLNATNAYQALLEISNVLRLDDKHGQPVKDVDAYISHLRVELQSILNTLHIDLEDV